MGVWKNDGVEIIANDQGNRTTPSYVAFTDTERLIGDAAKNQVARNPENTVFDAKRLIGRKFTDPVVQADIKLWPFKCIAGPDNKPIIIVTAAGVEKRFHAEAELPFANLLTCCILTVGLGHHVGGFLLVSVSIPPETVQTNTVMQCFCLC